MHLDSFQGCWPHTAHINFMGLTLQPVGWITHISFFFYPTLKSQKEENSGLLITDFSLHSPKTCKEHVTNWILLRLQIHSKGVCSIKIKAPELLYIVAVLSSAVLYLFVVSQIEAVCLKYELAIGDHSGELALSGHFLPERRTVQLQKSKINSSDLRYSFSWTVVTKVVKFAFWSDGWFYQSRSGSATATEALSCQLKRKTLSINGWFDSRALPCEYNSGPSTKTWWWMPQLSATEKCLSITLSRLKQNFTPKETQDFDFLKLRNMLCYISLD